MSELHIAVTVIGALVLGLGLLSRPLERLPLSAPMLSLLLGVALGPKALAVLDPSAWGNLPRILEEGARLTIAIGLMAIALRLPPDFLARHWRALAALLLVVMPLTALAGGLVAYWTIGMPLLGALLVGAVICPTDPIVATAIVTGSEAEKRLPARLRHVLLGESGANDGLAFPLVSLFALLAGTVEAGMAERWLLHTAWHLGGALLAGALIGHAAARALIIAERHHAMEIASFFAYTLALTFLTLGAAELLDTESLLAVFASGLAFSRSVGERERNDEERVQEAINGFFTLPIFALIGLAIPWDAWGELGWRAVAFGALILLLRRLPALLVLRPLVPALQGSRDALFAGWFGPIGVAALLYAMVAQRQTGDEWIWPLASLAICASVLVHGATGAPFTRLYGRGQRAAARLAQEGRTKAG